MILDCRCDAEMHASTKEACISAVIKEKKTRNYFLREKINITCDTSNQAEYLAMGRLILRVIHLQEYNIVPQNLTIHLYSDNKAIVGAIRNERGVNGLDINMKDNILMQYQKLISNNVEVNLQWIRRTKNKEAHRYLYDKKHLGRRLIEIVPDLVKFIQIYDVLH